MRRLVAITGNRFLHRRALVKGNLSSLCGVCCFWGRGFSGASYDYREKIRGGFLQDVKLDDAIGLFSEMVKSRPLPSIVDFRSRMQSLCLIKWWKWDKPDTVTFNTLIHGLFLHNKVSEAVSLVERMMLKGCQPDELTYGALVNGVCKRGETDWL
ncbi:unnamed protein product [Microthlaspi erraticum]|uniref:Pentacotripeptide-repeat region of PRORP domain-containing protein n=1 Tax=Microthlaspi erraticum TaxID=1685480 RepID=A0A6D2I486_9BRAS|nr:unnamed protein product [Microthlaspi erraticum]